MKRRIVSALYRLAALALYVGRVRFLRLAAPGRIGHLSVEPDSFVKAGKLGLRPSIHGILIAPHGTMANDHLLDYWARYFSVVRSEHWASRLRPFISYPWLRYDTHHYLVAINETAEYIRVQNAWEPRPALLSLTSADREWGERQLRRLGIPHGAWYVCIHSREGGYSPDDEHMHRLRNSEIESYLLAAKEIHARGGWCIRMGDPSMKKLAPIDGVVDYAHSAVRNARMDVFLCGSCRFFLGNTSGIFLLSCVFGVPVVVANCLPMSATLPFGSNDLGLPKLIRYRGSSRLLTFREILESEIANYRFSELYERDGLDVINNTAEDIRDASVEMLERLEGKIAYTEEDEALQTAFKALLRPGHYTYGSRSRVARGFLRKHRELLVS